MGTPENEAQEIRPDCKNPISPGEDVFEEFSGPFTSDRDPYIPPEVEKRSRRHDLIFGVIFWTILIGIFLAVFWSAYKGYKRGERAPYSGNWL
jgi:hypothetical protein